MPLSGQIGYRADRASDKTAVHKDTVTANIERTSPEI